MSFFSKKSIQLSRIFNDLYSRRKTPPVSVRRELTNNSNFRRTEISFGLRDCLCLLVALQTLSTATFAQIAEEDLHLPISIAADSTKYDGKRSMLLFRGLHLTQGPISIDADEARATNLDFKDSTWHFSGNVIIDKENGHIECNAADLHFSDHQLQIATITGTPATFELQRPEGTDTTYGEASRLDYNFELGIIEFSENATITEGGNKISSNYLVYNIADQSINARSAGTEGERVKITYTPTQPDTPDAVQERETSVDSESASEADGDNGP